MVEVKDKEYLPRQKADKYGISSLSDAELLALLIETGNKDENVIQLSKRLLKEKGGLNGIFNTNEENLYTAGLKKGKAYRLIAVNEIHKRIPLRENKRIITSLDCYKACRNYFQDNLEEKFMVMYLSIDKSIIRSDVYTNKKANQVELPFSQIAKTCLKIDCKYIILIHNHPSNNLQPSKMDLITINTAFDKFLLINIVLLDSLIITDNSYLSFKDVKLGPFSI